MINVRILLKFYFICSFFLQFYTEKIMCLKVSNSADTFPLWNLRSAWILCKFFWGIILLKNMQSLYLGLFCAIWSQGLIFEDIITVFSLDSCVGGCTFLMSNNNFEIICKIFIRLFKCGHDTRSLSFHSSQSLSLSLPHLLPVNRLHLIHSYTFLVLGYGKRRKMSHNQ